MPKTRIPKITAENEGQIVAALRNYYALEFKNGNSDEAFVLWIQTFLDLPEDE